MFREISKWVDKSPMVGAFVTRNECNESDIQQVKSLYANKLLCCHATARA